MKACRTIPLWNLAVAQYNGKVSWQRFNGAYFIRTHTGRVFYARKLAEGYALVERTTESTTA